MRRGTGQEPGRAGGEYGASSRCVYTTVRVAIVVDLYKGNGGARPVRRFLRQDFVYPLPVGVAHGHGTPHEARRTTRRTKG